MGTSKDTPKDTSMLQTGNMLEDIKKMRSRNHILRILTKYNKKVICEVGVETGAYFKVLLQSKPQIAVAVDLWRGDDFYMHTLNRSQDQIDELYNSMCIFATDHPEHNIKIMRMHSHDAAIEFVDNYFDFVYIDADHRYEAVLNDMHCWWNKVKPGGILGGHDYRFGVASALVRWGVVEAVHEFLGQYKLRSKFATVRNNWYIIKPD